MGGVPGARAGARECAPRRPPARRGGRPPAPPRAGWARRRSTRGSHSQLLAEATSRPGTRRPAAGQLAHHARLRRLDRVLRSAHPERGGARRRGVEGRPREPPQLRRQLRAGQVQRRGKEPPGRDLARRHQLRHRPGLDGGCGFPEATRSTLASPVLTVPRSIPTTWRAANARHRSLALRPFDRLRVGGTSISGGTGPLVVSLSNHEGNQRLMPAAPPPPPPPAAPHPAPSAGSTPAGSAARPRRRTPAPACRPR